MKNYVISWIDIKHNFLLMKIDLRQSHKLLKMITLKVYILYKVITTVHLKYDRYARIVCRFNFCFAVALSPNVWFNTTSFLSIFFCWLFVALTPHYSLIDGTNRIDLTHPLCHCLLSTVKKLFCFTLVFMMLSTLKNNFS